MILRLFFRIFGEAISSTQRYIPSMFYGSSFRIFREAILDTQRYVKNDVLTSIVSHLPRDDVRYTTILFETFCYDFCFASSARRFLGTQR